MTMRRWVQLMSAVCVGILLATIAVWVFQRISQILCLFAAGFIIAYVFDPLLDRMESWGWSRGRAVLTVTAGLLLIGVVVAAWVVPSLYTQAQHLAANWPEYSDSLDDVYQNSKAWIGEYADRAFPDWNVTAYLDERVLEAQQWFQDKLPIVMGFLTDAVFRSVSLVAVMALVGIISIHFMLAIDLFKQSVRELLPKAAAADVDDIGSEVGRMLAQYVRGQFTMMLVAGTLAAALMFVVGLIFGTDYALVVGLISGLTYVIPWVGAGGSAVAGGVFAFVSAAHDPVWATAIAVVAMIAVNQTCDQIFLPRIIGRKVGLHPLVVIFSILAGLQLFGVVGMVFAAPAAASIKIILARWLPLKRVEVKPGKPPPLSFDIRAAIKMGFDGIESFARRLEDVVGVAPTPDEPTEQEDTDSDDDTGTP